MAAGIGQAGARGDPHPLLGFSVLLVRMESGSGFTAVYGNSTVAAHNSPPPENEIHPPPHGPFLSHTILSP